MSTPANTSVNNSLFLWVRHLFDSIHSHSSSIVNAKIFYFSVPAWTLALSSIIGASTIGIIWKLNSRKKLPNHLIEFSNSIVVTKKLLTQFWNEYDVDQQNWLEPEEIRSLITNFAEKIKNNKNIIQQYVDAIFNTNIINNNTTNNNNNNLYEYEYLKVQASESIRQLFDNIAKDSMKIFPIILAHLEQPQTYNNTNNINTNTNTNNNVNSTDRKYSEISNSLTSLNSNSSSQTNITTTTQSGLITSSNNTNSPNITSSAGFDSPRSIQSNIAQPNYKIYRNEFFPLFCMWVENCLALKLNS